MVTRKQNGYRQMAIDEAILDAVAKDRSPETIRLFDFDPIAITVGRLQHVDDELLDACQKNKIDMVRRLTGGRIVVHAGDFTFSLIVHTSNPFFGGSIHGTYQAVSAPFLASLRAMGIPAEWRKAALGGERGKQREMQKSALCFNATARYEIVVQGKKILGISQYRRADTILVQGTLLLRKPNALYRALFGALTSTDSFSSVADAHRMPVGFEEMEDSIRVEIERTYGVSLHEGALSPDESDRVTQLTKEYRAQSWAEKGV